MERRFVTQGGYSEQLAAARLHERAKEKLVELSDHTDRTVGPGCPFCGGTMVIRTAKHGVRTGSQFWGCAKYPSCRGTRPLS